MGEKIKIFVSCHKKCYVPQNEMFYPVQVGAAMAKERFEGMLCDDAGDNISDRNKTYCELTAQYWAWKNEEADYYGFFHYRRYFSFAEEAYPVDAQKNIVIEMLDKEYEKKFGLNEKRMREVITNEDIIVSKAYDVRDVGCKNIYQQYVEADSQYQKDIDLMLTVIHDLYPEYEAAAKKYMNSTKSYICNMFIMKKTEFQEYSKWYFDILFEVEKRADFSNYSDYAYRVMGFLGERLLGIYITYLKEKSGKRIRELQRIFLCHTEPEYKDTKKNDVVVAMVTGEGYAPSTAATIRSIALQSNLRRRYKIICFTRNLSDMAKKCIFGSKGDRENIDIEFADMERCIFNYRKIDEDRLVSECSIRLLLQDFLKDYDKVLYLDSDCIVKKDIAMLYDTKIDQYWYGACKDIDVIGSYNHEKKAFRSCKYRKYLDEVLKLENPYNFYQHGILLINVKKISKELTSKAVIQCLKKQEGSNRVKDAFNVLAENKIYTLDLSWNVVANENTYNKDIFRKDALFCLPRELLKEYQSGKKNPAIVHYAGSIKPWHNPASEGAQEFWMVLRTMDEYEMILFRTVQDFVANVKMESLQMINNNVEPPKVAEVSKATKFARRFLPERIVQKLYRIKCKIMN